MLDSYSSASDLVQHLLQIIDREAWAENRLPKDPTLSPEASAVLFLLGKHPRKKHFEPCLILTKRSQNVKQSGDLCFPGGRLSPRLDGFLSVLLTLPGFPLGRWPHWLKWRRHKPFEAKRLALLLATSLRESFEEVRLNPFNIEFLGPLPNQKLRLFQRVIYPMAAWVKGQNRFVTNWEVEKVVYVSLKDLLNPENYCRYRLQINHGQTESARVVDDFPCFRPSDQNSDDILWGATYRMAIVFLQSVFGFEPPQAIHLPVFHGMLDENYYVNASG